MSQSMRIPSRTSLEAEWFMRHMLESIAPAFILKTEVIGAAGTAFLRSRSPLGLLVATPNAGVLNVPGS